MKRSGFLIAVFMLTAAVAFSGCGSSGGGGGNDDPPETTVLLSDDFEDYSGYPVWEDTGDWEDISSGQEGGDAEMAIRIDDEPGGQGKFVRHTDGGWSGMVNNAFTGSDYTFSMKIKPGTTGELGLMGRYNSLTSYYYLQISGGENGCLALYKSKSTDYVQVGLSAEISYNTETYYILKLKFDGNEIIGSFIDGNEVTTVSYQDDGEQHGSVIESGKIGFGGDQSTIGTNYDDVLVVK